MNHSSKANNTCLLFLSMTLKVMNEECLEIMRNGGYHNLTKLAIIMEDLKTVFN